jgi:hypothetical protein
VTAPVPLVVRPGEPAVSVTDVPAVRVHHPGDLLEAVLAVLGVAVMMLAATYAQHTASGVAQDVQGFATLLQRILFVPVNVLAALVTMLGPIAVLTELAARKQGRLLLLSLAAGFGATALNLLVSWVIVEVDAQGLERGLSVWISGGWQLSVPAFAAMLAGLLTVAGPHGRRRTVAWTWNLLWAVVGIMLIAAQVSLPGLAVALLIGRAVGLYVRYLGGVEPEQAYGQRLVAGVQRAGFAPLALVRVPDAATAQSAPSLPPADPASVALARSTGSRVYALTTIDGRRLDLVVMDGDRQVVGMLRRTWRSIRLRGIDDAAWCRCGRRPNGRRCSPTPRLRPRSGCHGCCPSPRWTTRCSSSPSTPTTPSRWPRSTTTRWTTHCWSTCGHSCSWPTRPESPTVR